MKVLSFASFLKALIWVGLAGVTLFLDIKAKESWESSPTVTSVSFQPIFKLEFPAVTVCAPSARKWNAIADLLSHFDTDKKILDLLANHENVKSQIFAAFHEAVKAMDIEFLNAYELEAQLEVDDEIRALLKMGLNSEITKDEIDIALLNGMLEKKSCLESVKRVVCNSSLVNCTFLQDPDWYMCKGNINP